MKLRLGALWLGLFVAACDGGAPDRAAGSGPPAANDTAEVTLELTSIPAAIQCVQIRVAIPGAAMLTSNLPVAPGTSSATLGLGRLPPGMATFNGSAFDVACAAVGTATPLWIADAVTVTLAPGLMNTVAMTFRSNNPVVVRANFLNQVVEIAAGTFASYARLGDGTIRQWGTAGPFRSLLPTPTLVTGAQQIAAGNGFACAIVGGGVVQCWGDATLGSLTLTSTPTIIRDSEGSPIVGATSIAAGNNHACSTISTVDTFAECWGSNALNQLGDGTTFDTVAPVQVVGSLQAGLVFAGGESSCFIDSFADQKCWGANANSQFGFPNAAPTPLGAKFSRGAVRTAMNQNNVCFMRGDGHVRCAGSNGVAQLGIGAPGGTGAFQDDVVGITDAVDIAVGLGHACALHRDGTVSCWGASGVGQIGDGSGIVSPGHEFVEIPALVVGLSGAVAIRAGQFHTCALLGDMRVMCWGANDAGQLGDGTIVGRTTPVFVKLQ